MINRLKNKNADFLTTITQAANIPAIRTWEKAGFKLYKVTNLYSIKND
jgi:ribosomal protein S18 acetylase RimI-like enzyme